MKKLIFYLGLSLLGFTFQSCETDEPENTVSSSNGFLAVTTSYWSSQEYLGVKVGEYHTTESNLSFSAQTPEGYQLYLVDMKEKDEQGMNVFYIEADMAQITQTYVCSENTKLSDADLITIPFSISYSKPNGSGKMESEIRLRRFKCPIVPAELLKKDRKLLQESTITFDNWVHFNEDDKPESYPENQLVFTSTTSPLRITCQPDGTLSYVNTYDYFTNWPYTTHDKPLPLEIKDGIW